MSGDDYDGATRAKQSSGPSDLDGLLQCQDREFVETAYRLILRRDADSEGLKSYLSRVRNGVSKLQILNEISSSDEGRRIGTELKGLRWALRSQKLSSVPVLGRLFRHFLGSEGNSSAEVRLRVVEHQPYILRDALSALIQRQNQVERLLGDLKEHQFPTLLQTLSDLNHRQLVSDNGLDNLRNSVPVALRKLTQDLAEVRSHHERLAAAQTQLAELSMRSEQRFNETGPKLENLSRDVSYLLGRVEFVRRELMFEMRYGASTPSDEPDRLKAETAIVSPEKLAVARKTGIRLNLGCGHICLEGYLNVDRRRLPGVDIVAEVDDLPFEAGDVTEIRSAHLIEHFPQEQLRRTLLPYWFGLLRPGGDFTAIAPDARAMMTIYLAGEYPFEQLREVTFGGQDYDGDFHYNMLTTGSFTKLLEEAGFVNVSIVAENRVNGACKEFEIAARRPSANA
jgi:predicted SAM-dependent methyltransferase